MGKEIEKKFLVKGEEWRKLAEGTVYRQGYLSTVKERTVRVRTIGSTGYLTVKGITIGASRLEYEYEISVSDSNEMLDELCEKPIIEKKRYKVDFAGMTWEIDEFFGENDGLIVAEIELQAENQDFKIPDWIGQEVTADPRYFNSNLTKHPFSKWDK
ncbi:MAG: CYTH domain-containing protein [bacterium]|nr:CYTH domain-containing protein [bacterium]